LENLQMIEDFYADAIDTVSTRDSDPGDVNAYRRSGEG